MTEKKASKPQKTQAQKDAEAFKKALKSLKVEEFVAYIRSPWRIMWTNLLAGIFRGLGTVIGVTVVFAILLWVVTQMVDFPLIGQYFADLKDLLESFSQDVQQEGEAEPDASEPVDTNIDPEANDA